MDLLDSTLSVISALKLLLLDVVDRKRTRDKGQPARLSRYTVYVQPLLEAFDLGRAEIAEAEEIVTSSLPRPSVCGS
jgi:hypothetical protein